MGEIKIQKDLEEWLKSFVLFQKDISCHKDFSSRRAHGLTSQIRRAAVSIPSNIAEGAARQTSKEYIQYLYIALGSLSELETQFIVAKRISALQDDSVLPDIEHLRRKLLNFIKYRKSKC